MRSNEQPETVGELVDMIPPGETIQFGGFEIRRWPEEPSCRYSLPHPSHPFTRLADDERPFDQDAWCWGVPGDHTQPATNFRPYPSEGEEAR